jgi:predicted metalloprotease
LKDAAEETRPRQWTDYIKGALFLPLVRSLERDGSLNVIPSSLAARFLETERVTLETGYRFTHMVEEKLVPLVEAVIRQKVADSNVSISGKSYGVINVGTIVLDPRFRENMVTRFRDGTLGCGIELSAQRGRSRSLYLNPEKISSEGIVDVLTEIGARAGEDEVIRSRASELRQSIGTLERALKTVADRIKEPNPFLETLIGLLPKIGKRPNRQSRAV